NTESSTDDKADQECARQHFSHPLVTAPRCCGKRHDIFLINGIQFKIDKEYSLAGSRSDVPVQPAAVVAD
mgnify:CR=1